MGVGANSIIVGVGDGLEASPRHPLVNNKIANTNNNL
jgi:hypothetical protein